MTRFFFSLSPLFEVDPSIEVWSENLAGAPQASAMLADLYRPSLLCHADPKATTARATTGHRRGSTSPNTVKGSVTLSNARPVAM